MAPESHQPVTTDDRGSVWGWDASYAGESPPLWDIGRPQPAFVRLAEHSPLRGRVLDVGCGTGEHALLAARCGAEATGVDIAPSAIALARRKARDRHLPADFAVADALDLAILGRTFDAVLDSGTFHLFDDVQRERYVAGLAAVLDRDGVCYLMCIADRQREPLDRPRRVSQDELRAAFAVGWTISSIVACVMELNPGGVTTSAEAWFATIVRSPD